VPIHAGRAWAFSVVVEKSRQATVLRLSGRFGHKAAPEFERVAAACVADNATAIVVDLTGVDYLSSPGLRAITALAARLEEVRGQVIVRGAKDAVRVTLGLADFSRQKPRAGS
jgi:anti-anti-sigma factor